MNNIFDSHAHYDSEQFNNDRDELLSGMHEKGVCAIINCADTLKSCKRSLVLAEKYNFIYAACGIHPHNAQGCKDKDYIEKIATHSKNQKCVAIGEIGLDYHYDFSPRELQKKFFEEQIILANELGLPVIVHDREAHEDTLKLLKKHRPKGVVHCFSGSAEMAEEIVKLGLYIGLGGAVTFKNARKPLEVARCIPAERLLVETDCPYMAPVPFRGTRCDSSMIYRIAEVLAGVRSCEAQEILNRTKANACELFKINL